MITPPFERRQISREAFKVYMDYLCALEEELQEFCDGNEEFTEREEAAVHELALFLTKKELNES